MCMKENQIDYPDIKARLQFCENFDHEAKILKGWQQALTNIHGNNSLIVPGVFVDSHLDWENADQKQTFMEQAEILLQEIRSRQGITCDADCIQRMQISVRTVQKQPKILGILDNVRVEEGTTLELVCELFYGFDKSVDENIQLYWIHNHSTIQNNTVSNIEISRRDLHDITKRTTLIRRDVPMTVSGMYQCRYGVSSADPISVPKIVTVFQILIGKDPIVPNNSYCF